MFFGFTFVPLNHFQRLRRYHGVHMHVTGQRPVNEAARIHGTLQDVVAAGIDVP
jgi:hypothetical protein